MRKIAYYFFGGIFLLFSFYACHDDDDNDDDGIPKETIDTNGWIKENMEASYLWNKELPDIDYTRESDPEAYFKKLLIATDTLSWITDDYTSLAAGYAGEPVTMGYDPTFYVFNDNETIFIVVDYVYPGSAADKAGLKRGDIILSIDNTDLNRSNYSDLYSGTSYSVQLGEADFGSDGSITIGPSGESLDLTAQVTTTDPAIYNTIFNINGHKIGYLVYVEFVTGSDNGFLNSLDQIFDEFKSEGISDLIVDLRYNPGGDIDAAAHLASEIAPSDVVQNEEILVSLEYNNDLQSYLESDPVENADYLAYHFTKDVSNANLSRVYFLTTSGTASASELTISGLYPYMEVVQIGEPTYGKYLGAWIIPDDNEEWAIVPIVMKYANADGLTDFADGLPPDYEMYDDLLTAVPFGDTSDPMVAKAIELATGESTAAVSASVRSAAFSRFKRLTPVAKEMKQKRNLYVPAPDGLQDFIRK